MSPVFDKVYNDAAQPYLEGKMEFQPALTAAAAPVRAFMLAQTREGIGCFLVPRLLEDGSSNGLRFQRLKDKLGNRSNASSEVEFSETFGFLLGAPVFIAIVRRRRLVAL